MKTPPSPHFHPIDLSSSFNARYRDLTERLGKRQGDSDWIETLRGEQCFRGIPLLFGRGGGRDVIELTPRETDIRIDIEPQQLTYLLFVHVVEDHLPIVPDGFGKIGPAQHGVDGNPLGSRVSTYSLHYEDGGKHSEPVFRRFAIQQKHTEWSASPFAAVPLRAASVLATTSENLRLGRSLEASYFFSEARSTSGRTRSRDGENLWLYALANPHPERKIVGVSLKAEQEASAVFAVSMTRVEKHPLRLQGRQKLRLRLPKGVRLNKDLELDVDDRGDQIGIDLGNVISARSVLRYEVRDWLSDKVDVQPVPSGEEVIVEYSAHPDSILYLRSENGALHSLALREIDVPLGQSRGRGSTLGNLEIAPVRPAAKTVTIRIVEKDSGKAVAARLHIHGPDGEYLPPKGHQRKVNIGRFEDYSGEFRNGSNQYCYVDGTCAVDLPLGEVYLEVRRGLECSPLRCVAEIGEGTEVLTLQVDRVLRWREAGWISADTHVHFLSPQTALLEGKAEDVNVVNLLAAQWGELFTNVADFDGCTTIGAKDFGGDGEFLVRVGTENRMQVLGHISLLGYEGQMIHPLSCAGSDEAAIGDLLESTMASWAERCRSQGGLVVLPHAPNPQAERAADIVLGVVDAMEMMSFNPSAAQISAFGLADWYRFLNIGYRLPLVAGSDKMDASALLGGSRTYAKLAGDEFTYRNWMQAIRGGNTFITVGPLVEMTVEGRTPGSTLRYNATGANLTVSWRIQSVSVRASRVEVIKNGLVVGEDRCDALQTGGSAELRVTESCWIAIRVRGSVAGRDADIAAHTSAVYIEVGEKPIFAIDDAVAVLAQIEGSIAYVDTLAPRTEEARHGRLRALLELAHHRLHHRLHELGAHHAHAPIHSAHVEREH